jgi:hypothetical protein
MIASDERGVFAQTSDDIVFLSRFQNDVLFYSQNRAGYTIPGPLQLQLTWNGNITEDRNRQVWANFFETGPGARFRWKGMPKSLVWSVDVLRGWYLMPGRKPYYDIRAGVWYAYSR